MTDYAATAAVPATLSDKVSGAWAFIMIECATFSAYFIVYMLYRMHDPAVFAEAQTHLSPAFGLVNTLILLGSSWQVARSVQSARAGRYDAAFRQAALTVALGLAFVVSKLSEWGYEIERGFSFETNDFFAFYFFLTGIHVVHVLLGFVFMGVALYKLHEREVHSEALEIAGIYWHMVDFLWVVIFALLYVVR